MDKPAAGWRIAAPAPCGAFWWWFAQLPTKQGDGLCEHKAANAAAANADRLQASKALLDRFMKVIPQQVESVQTFNLSPYSVSGSVFLENENQIVDATTQCVEQLHALAGRAVDLRFYSRTSAGEWKLVAVGEWGNMAQHPKSPFVLRLVSLRAPAHHATYQEQHAHEYPTFLRGEQPTKNFRIATNRRAGLVTFPPFALEYFVMFHFVASFYTCKDKIGL